MCSEGFLVHVLHARIMRLQCGGTVQGPKNILFYAQIVKRRGTERDSGSEAGMWKPEARIHFNVSHFYRSKARTDHLTSVSVACASKFSFTHKDQVENNVYFLCL